MKKIQIFLSLLFYITLSNAAYTELTAKKILNEQKKRHKVKSELATEIMILVDKSGSKEKRIMKRYAKDIGNDLNRFLIVFTKPAEIKGTALLTWEQNNRNNDQWMFLPAQKRMQRIAKGSKKSYFMGTDFTYEDMEPEDIDNFNYKILRSENFNGNDCWVIESKPANKKKIRQSGYSKRNLWIRKNNYYTIKIDFFDRRNKLIKTQTNIDLVNIKGTVWRAKKSLMVNHKRKHKTVMGVKFREINININNNIFTERYIVSGRHMK